jgi:hypothetical protein
MGTLVMLAAMCAAPAVVFYGLDKGLSWLGSYDGKRPAASAAPGLPRDHPSLQQLVADLQRLEDEYRRIEHSDLPAKVHRLQAVSMAYDDVLCECCSALGLPPPAERPLRSIDRLEAQVELARHGLTW